MTIQEEDMTADQAELDALRQQLSTQLAIYRKAAGISQPELGAAIDKTRSTVSKIEHGRRGMPAEQWKIADDLCHAEGALVAGHTELAQVEQAYRDRCRAQRRAAQRAAAQAELHAVKVCPAPQLRSLSRPEAQADRELISGELAEELMEVTRRLARFLPRREAIQLASQTLAAVGLTGLDPDESTRVAQAVETPRRVDGQVIENLVSALAHSKRLEDKLGPTEVLDTVLAQHGLVRRLIAAGCPEQWRQPLLVVDSKIGSTIGSYLIDMDNHDTAQRYLQRARKSGHDARSASCAAYAAVNMSMSAFLRGETHTALDSAAAARSLAARTDDARLKALAEQMAAAAYALDGQYGPCMAACARAQEFLVSESVSPPDSPAYWVHEGTLGSQLSLFLTTLGKPKQAVEAAGKALARYDPSQVSRHAFPKVRLGNALVLSQEIDEAARVLGDAATLARQSPNPRLMGELYAARTRMQPWQSTQAVKTLDARLHAYGLAPRQGRVT